MSEKFRSVLYCHGFASSFDPGKPKIKALERIAPVRGVTVDYAQSPFEAFNAYLDALKGAERPLIVGTSLGGFFAAWVGSELNLPFIAINPAIRPLSSLRAYLGEGVTHFGAPFILTEEVVDAYRDLPFRTDGPGRVVLDMGDEVISSHDTLNEVCELPVLTFPGGSHRFDHMGELVDLLIRPEG
jgi:predicted esterase YcpF (UPF0227 family)